MDITKEIKMIIKTTDGAEINVGDTVIFSTTDGKCLAGTFTGLGARNVMMFNAKYKGIDELFKVMPTSIKEIYIVALNEPI